ncbi:proline rich transmembrane protein 1B-like [Pantherophis guttatus]|uniref:Proline rich transmembrane protein 1B-like n=1 Tax=Pantherophis guttatus TaxID=94885 RepID=A0A6P9C5H8_PANGU|nr:proline rich transmembrane protein 1B-like [Pantherophis guttatus]
MSNPENGKTSQMNESFHPGQQPDPMKSAMNPPPAVYGTSPSMPYQYQPYAGHPGAIHMQPEQTILMSNVQSVNEPDYLGYSIFTLLCCCLPLGIVALIYSIKTQGANQQRDIASAKRYSRRALTLDHAALGLGIAWIVLAIILVIVFRTVAVDPVVSVHQGNFGNIGNYNP